MNLILQILEIALALFANRNAIGLSWQSGPGHDAPTNQPGRPVF